LLLPWTLGARWFWDTLVDADLASNTLGWQWVAGCGADAAPFFRIFNPTAQGTKFDPAGAYVRHWVPELAALPNEWLHCPWSAPPPVLEAAGVRLGRTYPHPVVDHAVARKRALAALNSIKNREDPPKSDFFADNGRSIGTKSAEQPVSSLGQHFAHAAGYQRGDIEQGARHSQTSRGGEIAGPPDRQKLLLELAQPSKG